MPQPIDPNTELARLTATERIQQIADRSSIAAQTRVSEEATAARNDAETNVQQTNQKSEEVDQELRRRNPFIGRRRKKKSKDRTQEDTTAHTFYNADERSEIVPDPDDHDLDVTI